jgi:hypothetical protein
LFLLLHNLATNRFARMAAAFVVAFSVALAVIVAQGESNTRPEPKPLNLAGLPACVSQPDPASSQDCLTAIADWCQSHQPALDPATCATDVLISSAAKP